MPRTKKSDAPKEKKKRELPAKLKLWSDARKEAGLTSIPKKGTKEYDKVKKIYDEKLKGTEKVEKKAKGKGKKDKEVSDTDEE